MKTKFWLVIAVLMCVTAQSQAVPVATLVVDDPDITVGEQFSVEVRIDNDVINEEFLAFGFNLQAVDPLLSFAGFSVASEFVDSSFGMNNVSGLAFPGITDTDILLATLVFDALDAGTAQISIQGLFDGLFSGMFYEFSGFDISAQTNVAINQRPPAVPEPTGLFVAGMVLLMCIGRGKRSSTVSRRQNT